MRLRLIRVLLLAAFASALALAAGASAAPLADDGGAEWQVEQPLPPPPEEPGAEPAGVPVSLGHIGDVEFFSPDEGALITAGNGGSVKAGVWFYNGIRWQELSNQCGATDGRIAWASPDEFWTISDGRAGQAVASSTERPPLEDNTLCRFGSPDPAHGAPLQILASYASVPFLGSSYQKMLAAACLSPEDCWFAGEPLPAPQFGAFMLHWNGVSLVPEPYFPEKYPVSAMAPFEGRLYQTMRLVEADQPPEALEGPQALRMIKQTVAPEESPFENEPGGLPLLYSESEFPFALDYLRVSPSGDAIWAAAGPQLPKPAKSREAGVTIIRKVGSGGWRRVIGPAEEGENEAEPPPGAKLFPGREVETNQGPEQEGPQVLDSIAAEPGTESAWVALDYERDAVTPRASTRGLLARVSSEGTVSDRLELPEATDPHGPLGAVTRIACPAVHDCWAVTGQGWLLHLATGEERNHPQALNDQVFSVIEGGTPITVRPRDEGVPQEVSDEVPENNSGQEVFEPKEEVIHAKGGEQLAKVTVPLVSNLRSRVIHRTTLVLSFHLAVKARVRLLAERRRKVVARTARVTLQAGNRSLRLKLNLKRWPTRLNLEKQALAPLPEQTTAAPNVNTVSTSFVAPARLLSTGLIP